MHRLSAQGSQPQAKDRRTQCRRNAPAHHGRLAPFSRPWIRRRHGRRPCRFYSFNVRLVRAIEDKINESKSANDDAEASKNSDLKQPHGARLKICTKTIRWLWKACSAR